ncbi:MAG TPA: hypothetical protein VGR78_13465 [Verrucomicrobiae bacterium]|jgi:hypothetical protein|nr:hypothetical protein [Verrucomicrobiae bacterium]
MGDLNPHTVLLKPPAPTRKEVLDSLNPTALLAKNWLIGRAALVLVS